jgi:hypothetical protein
MHLKHSSVLGAGAFAALAIVSGTAGAKNPVSSQICTLGSAAVGSQGTLICKDVLTEVTTQSIALGPTFADAGGIGGSLRSHGDRVLVTNQAGGAVLLGVGGGILGSPVALQTNAEGSLSGALSDRGAYVLTGTTLRFYPNGQTTASSSRPLMLGDGSAAEVTLTDHYAYVSEKNGSLEAFTLGRDGSLVGPATAVAGIDPGVIVGIAGHDDLVVAPIAHLASNAGKSEISVVAGLRQAQMVPTKEVAACWTTNEDSEECVSNPGSMTVSCGQLGVNGFESYTSAAASVVGDSMFDIDMRDRLVGIQAIHGGAAVMAIYERTEGDFLTFMSEVPVGTAKAAGALLLPPLSR